jgi:hypothetical protein
MASGVDTLGILYANENGLPVDKFYADWKTFGNRAGSIRNEQMAQVGEALIVLWDGQSSGTRRMISSAMARGLKIYCHSIAEFLPQ